MEFTRYIDTQEFGEICLDISIDHYNKVEGSFSRNAPSDVDYYGYEQIDFTVLRIYNPDNNEVVAYELTEEDKEGIEQAIRDKMEEEAQEYDREDYDD